MSNVTEVERIPTVIIGAGQSGLSLGYHLKQRGLRFVILESNARVGDTWRKRWDSLRLFTPARFDSLVGMPFPAHRFSFPTKDDMADYLESYAKRFDLPVRTGVTVDRVSRHGTRFLIEAGGRRIEADQVVVAMANYQKGHVPAFATELSPEIVQLHSSDYRRPSQLREGSVLIVGAGNSGSEIAMELARAGHPVWMSGRNTGELPFKLSSFFGQRIMGPLLLRFVFHRVLTTSTPMGRRVRASRIHRGAPLIRVRSRELADASVTRVPRVSGVTGGAPVLEDGRVLGAANIVWCTGFEPGFSFLDLAAFDEQGEPKHDRGVSYSEPGLYFSGLHFLHAFSSVMIHGADRDAAHIAKAIERRIASTSRLRSRDSLPNHSPAPQPVR